MKSELDSFRIIGVKVFDDCREDYRKVLKGNQLYLFCNDFQEDGSNVHTLKRIEDINVGIKKATDGIYDIVCDNGHKVNVNISAIVGSNGCGKSSIIEIIIRLLNNFAYSFGFPNVQKSLSWIEGLSAVIYYEIGENIFAIEQESGDTSVALYKNGEWYNSYPNSISDEEKYDYVKGIEEELFYTILVNYSLYAYNSNFLTDSYNNSHKPWLDALFYKNDAYQTPIVINPMRERGNININKEYHLFRQRLLLMYSRTKSESERMIDNGIKAKGFAFKVTTTSKLYTKDILDYFCGVSLIDRPWENFETLISTYDGKRSFIKSFTSFAEDLVDDIENRNPELWKWVDTSSDVAQQRLSDLGNAFVKVSELFKELLLHNNCFSKIYDWFVSSDKYRAVNITQLYRVYVIEYVWELLKERRYVDGSINDAIINNDSPKAQAMLYLVHKVISIFTTYRPYRNRATAQSFSYDLLLNKRTNYMAASNIKSDFDLILSLHDYSTLKMWQTIHYIKRDGIGELMAAIDYQNDKVPQYDKLLTFDKLQFIIESAKDQDSFSYLEFLPPPTFEGDIILTQNGEDFPLESLSSGMTQRLNNTSSIVYHLRNLDYKVDDSVRLQYKNVNIILEEVELYFHPEYQKSLVKYVLQQIKILPLMNISNINLIFVSHSPFILSDILKQNVLCLKEGKVCREEILHTFVANVYDILKESFFLTKGAIGDIARDYIGSVTNSLKNAESGDRTVNRTELFNKIMAIDEPLVRKLLLDKFVFVFKELSRDEKIKSLEQQLLELKNS